ncbi:uncharacterized protein C8R40DRAFT_1088484 [Lentinula edodes]|uniref:uncharacterized protein n=1 Tax=Lentinula edodes TaxID=5353 RepID=UPI001E8CE78B|nr:uncharacterized protein C8R40DRAFT_1088484 [Lentinula edodes]KAH7879024.1 hypothetical protein C8R40DRAFT_1088484 [Lentinula edodes]
MTLTQRELMACLTLMPVPAKAWSTPMRTRPTSGHCKVSLSLPRGMMRLGGSSPGRGTGSPPFGTLSGWLRTTLSLVCREHCDLLYN